MGRGSSDRKGEGDKDYSFIIGKARDSLKSLSLHTKYIDKDLKKRYRFLV